MGRKRKKSTEERQLIALTNPRSPITEQYKTLRSNIEFSSVDQELKTIMVTSSNPSEGKSTTIANMAIVFAQQGKKVLLVDTDLRKPTVHYTFNLLNSRGLTNVLTKKAALEESIQLTGVENLFVLTCGPIPPNPAELLGSLAMKNLLATLREEFDLILFDTPPILAVTDAQLMANQCDGAILVISSGSTEIEAARKAKELLSVTNGKLVGAVLNKKKMKDSQYTYYYGQSS